MPAKNSKPSSKMNTTPDDTTIALWLEDELTGEAFVHVESWASAQPDQLAARESLRSWKARLSSALPASEEPPYADFFNSRIARAIREAEPVSAQPAAVAAARRPFWRVWLMPATAFAGMALAFLMGRQTSTPQPIAAVPAPVIRSVPVVYTPDRSVSAEWFDSNSASATVIVLQGIEAIPDATDFGETASLPAGKDHPSTAENAPSAAGEVVQ